MSKITLEKTIREELTKLNDMIDMKILRGLPYRREALRHRFLLARLHDMHRVPRLYVSRMGRFLRTVRSFML